MRATGVIFILLIIALSAAWADESAGDLAGRWWTAKGALLTCDDVSCVMTEQAPDEQKKDRVGLTVLKEYRITEGQAGQAQLIHPLRDDKYVPVKTLRQDNSLTLTLDFMGKSTSVKWMKAPDPVKEK